MKLEVAYRDERNNIQTLECTNVNEGEHGLQLTRNAGKKTAGYIPYGNLEYVTPKES